MKNFLLFLKNKEPIQTLLLKGVWWSDEEWKEIFKVLDTFPNFQNLFVQL